jgi:hypothetical protein
MPSPTPVPTPTTIAPAIALPPGFALAYNFMPTSVTQLVTGNADSSGATISTESANNVEHGAAANVGQYAIVNPGGTPALEVTLVAPNWAPGMVASEALDWSGFTAAPPCYWETSQYFPLGNNGWGQAFWMFSQGAADSYTFNELDVEEAWGNYGASGTVHVEAHSQGHNVTSSPGGGNTAFVYSSPAGGWQGGWHTFGILVTPAPNGSATYYLDGVAVKTWAAPSDSASVAEWNKPMFAMWNVTATQQTWNPLTSNNSFSGLLGYLRCWHP